MFKTSPFWIRLRHWEFWSMDITYIPVVIYFVILGIREKSFGFWAAVNPTIEYAGMKGDRKYETLSRLPQKYYPTTIFIPAKTSQADMFQEFQNNGLTFPVIGKPNIGLRGLGVKKLDKLQELYEYHSKMNHVDYMIQAYVPYEEEYAILHYRYPNEPKGTIMSVCKKSFLKIVGDGEKTVYELIMDYPRAVLQLKRLQNELGNKMKEIPKKGEVYPLGNIGNHCLGTEFLNYNHEIDEQLTTVFDNIEQSLEGVYLARYDLRCASMEQMKQGEGIYIMEINGTGAEVAHIYDTRMTFKKRYQVMLELWTIMYKIAKINKKNGHPYMSLRDIWNWRSAMKIYYPKVENIG